MLNFLTYSSQIKKVDSQLLVNQPFARIKGIEPLTFSFGDYYSTS